MEIATHIDLSAVEAGLRGMASQIPMRKTFIELKKPLRVDQKDHAKSKAGPEGAWVPRSLHTQPKRARRRLLGRLPNAVSYTTTATSLTAKSRIAWSGVHQDGGTAGRGSRIPARPFLWISSTVLDVAQKLFAEAYLLAFGRGR